MADDLSNLSNKEYNRIISERDQKDEDDLLAEVDKAGPLGFKLTEPNTSDGLRFLLASYRLCSNSNTYGSNRGLLLEEREPWVLIRKQKH
jgi:hypothetical protein